uniref:ING domain-containing protein n=1 Tax=Caenorhabditis tropicalis TaxID=1561998 RepID=A0A1I7URK6_9PELO
MSSVTDEQLEANMRRWPGEVGILATQIYDLAKERKINETAIKAMDEENKKLLEEIDELKIEHLEACLTGLQQEKDFYKRTVLMSEETTKDLDDYVKDFEKPFERKLQGTSDDSVTEEDEDDLEVPGFGQYRVQRKKPRIDRAE